MPTLAVLVALILAFVGIAVLIHFIHHIATSIQASSIVATAAEETLAAVEHLFPDALRADDDENADGDPASARGRQPWLAVAASKSGYVESLDTDVLLDIARTLATPCGWSTASGISSSRAPPWSRCSIRVTWTRRRRQD
ncbi:DUF2254 family protein [Lamprobacter modestohalophilus]|uniref:DUF2254 family protein n=1 Tax=Lamprobacter modestohalophilus TaxID=1064514 RepID=UPI002ADEB07B|nr:DUF2254 family protein [Lamprobacter modestohalophilus]MEA1052975.1 DUF2254 family protein [Lamprobacter modestohalophilus]